MNLGVVGNPRYEGLAEILRQLVHHAASRGLALYGEPRLAPFWPAPVGALDAAPLDALLTFGGDGTLLRGARLLPDPRVPILGLNLGRLGFLTTVSPEQLPHALDALVARRYALEHRLALQARVRDVDGHVVWDQRVLNDVVVHKRGVARVVRLDVTLDAERVGPYSADGLVVATPTGSTAYSLSAGGPVLVPGVEAMVVTPVCAHTLAVRPLVVPAHFVVTVEPLPDWADDLMVSLDGQTALTLAAGARVEVCRSAAPVSLVRLDDEGFVARMRRKFHWGDLSERERRVEP